VKRSAEDPTVEALPNRILHQAVVWQKIEIGPKANCAWQSECCSLCGRSGSECSGSESTKSRCQYAWMMSNTEHCAAYCPHGYMRRKPQAHSHVTSSKWHHVIFGRIYELLFTYKKSGLWKTMVSKSFWYRIIASIRGDQHLRSRLRFEILPSGPRTQTGFQGRSV
jgi:hypothetical protein